MPFRMKVKATALAKLDISKFVAHNLLGKIAFDAMRDRVQKRHASEDGTKLPKYKVKMRKPRPYPNVPWARRKQNVGKPWDQEQTPPDILAQIYKRGGVWRAKKEGRFEGGEPIYYGQRCPVREWRGKQWGYRWESREAYLAANAGGEQVDVTKTGDMWASPRVTVRQGKTTRVTIGFKGSVPTGSIFSLLKALKEKKRVSPSAKALLANSRGPTGAPTMTNPVEWLGMTDDELEKVIQQYATDVKKGLDSLPLEVILK